MNQQQLDYINPDAVTVVTHTTFLFKLSVFFKCAITTFLATQGQGEKNKYINAQLVHCLPFGVG